MSKIKYPQVVLGSQAYCEGFSSAIKQIKELNKDTQEDYNTDHLLDTIGALYNRNKGLQKGHATLTRRLQELEEQLEGCHEAISRLTGVAQNHVKRRMATEDGKSRILNISSTPTPLSDHAVDAIIADGMKPEPTAADSQLADDIYSLRRRIACDIHEWSQAAEPVLSRLATREHSIKFQNELRRSLK